MNLATSLYQIKGVGPKTAAELRRAGLETVSDILLFLPRKHEDFTNVTPIAELQPGKVTIRARCQQISTRPVRRGLRLTTAVLADDTSKLNAVWFNQPYRVQQLGGSDEWFYFSGTFEYNYGRYQLTNPTAELAKELPVQADRLLPVYHAVRGLKSQTVRKVIEQLRPLMSVLPETLPPSVVKNEKLLDRAAAISAMHFPRNEREVEQARQRLAFEELFELVLASQLNKIDNQKLAGFAIPFEKSVVQDFVKKLPFALTNAQRRAAWDILQDFEHARPMNRLLQGDVGSGKTIVAALSALTAIESGAQAAVMAPTEILAEQHFIKFKQWLEPLGLEVVWLSGSQRKKAKDEAKAKLADGSVKIAVGTHALFSDDVEFQNLGLVIVDEQHRFGVAQRLALKNKGRDVHQLMMSATPIPRTLAMSFFADLDVSVIDELPPGRTPIKTRLVNNIRRAEVEGFVLNICRKGQQAYWVCPLIEESETLQLQTATETLEQLQAALPELNIGLVHGRMKAAEKAEVMAEFAAGRLNVLVATTVIEVGVDVPNAALMVIEHAERMGLAQLHQLRGRVGRGAAESVCVLLFAEPLSELAKARLKVIYEHTDGFEIARQDLNIRGPGEFLGARQSGVPMLRFANLEEDLHLLEQAREIAPLLIEQNPEIVEAHLARWLSSREGYLGV